MLSLDEIIEKICEHAKISRDEVERLIEEKQDELSGLVSKEGAAYIIAREFGITLLKETERRLKIRNLIDGLRSVELVARVIDVAEPREFEKNGKKGKVVNVYLGDETGFVRLTLWNEEIDLAKDIKPGDVIKITRGYVRVDNRGELELRVGRGKLEKIDDVGDIPPTSELDRKLTVVKRKPISDFKEGDYVETRACVVQLFKKNPFFEVCPECGARLTKDNDKWICSEHGVVEPKYEAVISGVIDDGFGNIRAVFFREMAEKLFGKTIDELREIAKKNVDVLSVYDVFDGYGKDYIIRGRVKKNELTERMELVVNDISDVDIKKECEELISALRSSI